MNYKPFDIADVISVMFNIYICPNGPAGIYELLEHMVGHIVTEENFDTCVAACSAELKNCKMLTYAEATEYVGNTMNDIACDKAKGADSSKDRCAVLVTTLINVFSSTVQVKPIIKKLVQVNPYFTNKEPKFVDYIDFLSENKSGKKNGIGKDAKYKFYYDKVKKLAMEYPAISLTTNNNPDIHFGADGSITTYNQPSNQVKFHYTASGNVISEYIK